MHRINILTDDGHVAGWFDRERATCFEPQRYWDGSNMRDVNVGDKFDHQELYRTAQGRWVLRTWSQWQGSRDQWRFVSDDEAREWLIRNDEDGAVEHYFGELEEETGPNPPGRPEVGPEVKIRVEPELLKRIDADAEDAGETRAATVRRLLADTLA